MNSLRPSYAQTTDDPVIMVINGKEVPRSEFEYSYNKNNSEGVIDKKTVEEYVDLFVNYKLKVVAALDARLDTTTSFKKEFAKYRDQQVRPTLVTDDDVEQEARGVYDNWRKGIGEQGLIRPAHILLRVDQKATEQEQAAVKTRIDSVYNALLNGADFGELAKKVSEDPGSAPRGGQLPWIGPGQTIKEFEDQAYALQTGEMSQPFLTTAGYHIIWMRDRKQPEPYDTLRSSIIQYIEKRNARGRIANRKVAAMVAGSNGTLTTEEVMSHFADSLSAADPEMKNLFIEYHDGLLLYEISNLMVWDKASKDEAGLEEYFNKNKKKYTWSEPRFKGMVYHVKTKADVDSVIDCVKKLPFKEWAPVLRTTFNNDSTLRIRVEKGIFKAGDNALVDRDEFGKDTTVVAKEDYPFEGTYGKMLKKGPEDYTDVRGLVTADYQEELEKQWVAELRNKYAVEIKEDVLATVNNH